MRNIVLITLDSLRADHCSFMGYHRETTPTLDRMARKSLYFENAIAAGVGTPASMMGAFTGKFAPLTDKANPKIWRSEFARRKTLAQVLSKFGYSTGAIVPNTFASSYFGFDKGFQVFQDFLRDNSLYDKIFEGVFKKNSRIAFVTRNVINFLLKREVFMPWEKYYNFILDWVENTKNPFFLWILLMDTHFPYLAPRKYRKWSNLIDMYYANWKLQSVNFENKLTDEESQKLIDAYDDSIRYADEFIKRIIKDLSCYDPIFIIHADHGEGFGEHGYYMHGFVRNNSVCLYEELIHIPLLIYNADIKGTINEPVSLLGLAPAILEIINKNNEFLSKSFLNSRPKWVVVRAVDSSGIKVAIRMKNWKFIIGQNRLCELYNLKDDPDEKLNLVRKYSALANEMNKIAINYITHDISIKTVRNKILEKIKK